MEPVKFGLFLRELRKARELTQAQLAERLHVSGAAVSKWENGKCLPDVAKLEELAEILDISILELMRCEAAEGFMPRQELSEVFSETLKTARQQKRQQLRRALFASVLLSVLLLLLHFFPIYRMALVWAPSYFETGEVSLLAYIGSHEDRRAVQTVLAQAEMAFSNLSLTRAEAEAAYGPLGRYCITRETGAAGETHCLELWSAHLTGSRGTMWVRYSQEGWDKRGHPVTGSRDVPALWLLERGEDNRWAVTGIKEHP